MSTATNPIILMPKQDADKRLPIPKGYFLLIKMDDVPTGRNGIDYPDSRVRDEKLANPIGTIISMGPEAYAGDKFPSGPRCEIGNRVFIGSYVGMRLKAGQDMIGDDYRLIADDDVKAVVPEGSDVRRDI